MKLIASLVILYIAVLISASKLRDLWSMVTSLRIWNKEISSNHIYAGFFTQNRRLMFDGNLAEDIINKISRHPAKEISTQANRLRNVSLRDALEILTPPNERHYYFIIGPDIAASAIEIIRRSLHLEQKHLLPKKLILEMPKLLLWCAGYLLYSFGMIDEKQLLADARHIMLTIFESDLDNRSMLWDKQILHMDSMIYSQLWNTLYHRTEAVDLPKFEAVVAVESTLSENKTIKHLLANPVGERLSTGKDQRMIIRIYLLSFAFGEEFGNSIRANYEDYANIYMEHDHSPTFSTFVFLKPISITPHLADENTRIAYLRNLLMFAKKVKDVNKKLNERQQACYDRLVKELCGVEGDKNGKLSAEGKAQLLEIRKFLQF